MKRGNVSEGCTEAGLNEKCLVGNGIEANIPSVTNPENHPYPCPFSRLIAEDIFVLPHFRPDHPTPPGQPVPLVPDDRVDRFRNQKIHPAERATCAN